MSVEASEEDLMSAVTESLAQTGRLSKLKAKIRSEVLTVLDSRISEVDKNNMPHMNEEVSLINELIRDYLDWMEYKCTSSMLVAESGMTESSVSRTELIKNLNVLEKGNSIQVPVLVSIVSTFRNLNQPLGDK